MIWTIDKKWLKGTDLHSGSHTIERRVHNGNVRNWLYRMCSFAELYYSCNCRVECLLLIICCYCSFFDVWCSWGPDINGWTWSCCWCLISMYLMVKVDKNYYRGIHPLFSRQLYGRQKLEEDDSFAVTSIRSSETKIRWLARYHNAYATDRFKLLFYIQLFLPLGTSSFTSSSWLTGLE